MSLERGCSYSIYEAPQVRDCLAGRWVALSGSSQVNVWTVYLANLLATTTPALDARVHHFNIDGVFTELIDVIIEDGEVIYRKVILNHNKVECEMWRSYNDQRARNCETWHRHNAHSVARDATQLPKAFNHINDPAVPRHMPRRTRITYFFAQFWDNVETAVKALEGNSNWNGADLTFVSSLGKWYVNAWYCRPYQWCSTRPEYMMMKGVTEKDLMKTLEHDMLSALDHLERFCTNGRASKLGCSIASMDYCPHMASGIWAKISMPLRRAMQARSTELFRFVDVFKLTRNIVDGCLGGHQPQLSNAWTWQVFLSNICMGRTVLSQGTFAVFDGTCRTEQAQQHCPNLGRDKGFHYLWECAVSSPCLMHAVVPPPELAWKHPTPGIVKVDFALGLSLLKRSSKMVVHSRPWQETSVLLATVLLGAMVACACSQTCSIQRKHHSDHELPSTCEQCEQTALLSREDTCEHDEFPNALEPKPWIVTPTDLAGTNEGPEKYTMDPDSEDEDVKFMGECEPGSASCVVTPGDRFMLGPACVAASLHVAASHFYSQGQLADFPFFDWGFTWVPWFLMLSGFLLTSAQQRLPREETSCQHMVRHLASIYPLYAVSVLLTYVHDRLLGLTLHKWVLVAQAWLLQAFMFDDPRRWSNKGLGLPRWIAEDALQAHCWLFSCLLVYWLAFKCSYQVVSNFTRVCSVLIAMSFLFLLPWLSVLLPWAFSVPSGLDWGHEHIYGKQRTTVDFAVVFLKFNPLCYIHVFWLGMLLSRLRELAMKSQEESPSSCVQFLLHALVPLGYLGLLTIFLSGPAAAWRLPARLSILLPLQAAVLIGFAGIPGYNAPLLARVARPINFIERYSFGIYVMQHLCFDIWPLESVASEYGLYFVFLFWVAVMMVHFVQIPALVAWITIQNADFLNGPRMVGYKHHFFWLLPTAVSGLLLLAMHFDFPGRTDVHNSRFVLPSVYRTSDGHIDLRLPMSEGLHREISDHASRISSDDTSAINDDDQSLINPSFVFSGGSLVIAVHHRSLDIQHSNKSRWIKANLSRRIVTVIEVTRHSRILMGSSSDAKAHGWDDILHTGKAPRIPSLRGWSGLRVNVSSLHPWKDLCIRQRYIEKNHTLVLHRVTGAEDPKLMQVGSESLLAFSSYPPLGTFDCGPDGGRSQMYLAASVVPDDVGATVVGGRLDCEVEGLATKNWIPFEHRGKLYMVYSIVPHVVKEVFRYRERRAVYPCGLSYYSNFPPLLRLQAQQPGVAVRGSAQALFVKDINRTKNLPTPHYLGFMHIVDSGTQRYAHFAYRFSPEPPFDIVQVSTQLELGVLSPQGGGSEFAFLSSAALRNQRICAATSGFENRGLCGTGVTMQHACEVKGCCWVEAKKACFEKVSEPAVIIAYSAGESDTRAMVITLARLDELFDGRPNVSSMNKVQPK